MWGHLLAGQIINLLQYDFMSCQVLSTPRICKRRRIWLAILLLFPLHRVFSNQITHTDYTQPIRTSELVSSLSVFEIK